MLVAFLSVFVVDTNVISFFNFIAALIKIKNLNHQFQIKKILAKYRTLTHNEFISEKLQ